MYAVGRDGKAFTTLPSAYSKETPGDLKPLFDTILEEIPNDAKNEDKPFQMLISTLDYDNYVGKLCIGKIAQGTLNLNQTVSLVDGDNVLGNYKVQKLYTTQGLNKVDAKQVFAGDIATIAGIPELTIGQTLTDPDHPVSLPTIAIEEPTIKITIGPNTSPFAGKEGKYTTSRQIKDRLMKEKETNLGLRIEPDTQGVGFIVYGRGELHLAVLIEEMRREGFELEVSKPQVVYKIIDGHNCEPYEEVTIEVDEEFMGLITEEMGKRKGQLKDMKHELAGKLKIVYKISSANLLGIRNTLLTKTRGTAHMSSYYLGYEKKGAHLKTDRNGALIAVKAGTTFSYGLINAQDRGMLFVGVGTNVYEGMVVGVASRNLDIEVNVCKTKQLTNNRSSGEGVSEQLTPATILSLEQSLDFINDDELLEVTPQSLRIRKQHLSLVDRRVKTRLQKSLNT